VGFGGSEREGKSTAKERKAVEIKVQKKRVPGGGKRWGKRRTGPRGKKRTGRKNRPPAREGAGER